MAINAKRTLQCFCESTSLHGYGYLMIAKSLLAKVLWAVVIIIMTGIGMKFMVQNTKAYMESRLVTTIETSTAPIEEAVFPSLAICNFNQIESSYLRDLGIDEDNEMNSLFIKEYVKGKSDYTQEEVEMLAKIEKNIGSKDPRYQGRQWCENLFLFIKFQGKKFSWHDIPTSHNQPFYYTTDHGACCYLTPHILSGGMPENVSNKDRTEWYHRLEATAKHGVKEGLEMLLDVEQYNYGYSNGKGNGVMLSLTDHRDIPLLQLSSFQIGTGSSTQVVIKPVISYTTDEALNNFSPDERGCFKNEKHLEILRWDRGYRYEMSNCLVDQGLLAIFWNCRCIPMLIQSKVEGYSDYLKPCKGKNLKCADELLDMIGSQSYINKAVPAVEEAFENPHHIGNITWKPYIVCKPGCHQQENQLIISTSKYPPSSFFKKKGFCRSASHLLQVTCQDPSRKHYLELQYPQVCQILQDFELVFGSNSSCKNWWESYIDHYQTVNQTLVENIVSYGQDNLAYVKIFIQSPHITKYKRDVEMTFTDFVANTGGLLGLYLGFSVISLIEIFYFLVSFLRNLI